MELSMGRRLAPCSALGPERGRAIGAKGIYASPQDGAGTGPEGADCAGLRGRRQNKEVAASLGLDDVTVGKWRRRFVERRMEGLYDEPRSGAPRTIDDIRIEGVIVKTLESLPADATHWSSRGMTKASGLSVSSVQRIWRAFGLQPHRMETFKLSTDPDFVAKVRDVVGLYVSPPEHAIVLSVD